jgi:FlaA1/EpsC-like NDP-sugar epimerase
VSSSQFPLKPPAGGPIRSLGWLRPYLVRMLTILDSLPGYFYNRINQQLLEAACSGVAVYVAFQLRFEGNVPVEIQRSMWMWMIGFAAMRPLAMRLTNAYRTIWRYFGLRDLPHFFLSAATPTLFLLALRVGSGTTRWLNLVPASVLLLEFGLFAFLALGMRALRRVSFEAARQNTSCPRTLIVGSTDTLATAVRQVINDAEVHIVGLLTAQPELHGNWVVGMPVLGSPTDLVDHIMRTRAELILVTDAMLPDLALVIEQATILGTDVRLLPSAHNILRGEARASKPLNPEEVLSSRRAAVVDANNNGTSAFDGRSVLITGAGGSIGSELTRQVSALGVKRLVLLDRDENSLFEINRQLKEAGCTREIVPIVGDIRDRQHLEMIFSQTVPDIVLHAAAYKHVTMMETNAPEAVLNNVVGTREVLDVAVACGVERFVMISTDKAVHPSCIMGASKRIAELLVQSRVASLDGSLATQCACVRFGNVLGSRGSVVPIFVSQISQGGPVTITHEEMTRYFITIPEAVHLVLQAATLPSRGDVFMLDMGDPVEIVKLARKMIEASGLRPGKDIEIKVIGRRPGEKLHEQLCFDGSVVRPTEIAHIFTVQPQEIPPHLESAVAELERAARERDHHAVASRLMEIANFASVDLETARSEDGSPVDAVPAD